MHPSQAVAPQSNDESSQSTESVSAAGLPLADVPADFEAAVDALARCPDDELKQARKHHRRALKALREGAYDALSPETRERLTGQFRLNLRALNQALGETGATDTEEAPGSSAPPSSPSLREMLAELW